MGNKCKLSVIVPVYGSELVLPVLTKQLLNKLNPLYSNYYEIIFICDNSPDKSWELICSLSKKYKHIRGILLATNVGQHNAIMAGLENAMGEIIVTMDDDLQHSPEDIPILIKKIEAGYDVVYASFKNRNHPTWKVLGSKLNNMVAKYLIDKPKNLYLSPFRAIKSHLIRKIVSYKGPYVYLDGLILSSTRNISSVQVNHYERANGKSYYGLKKSISLWLKMATSFSILPLRLTSFLGIIISIFGFIFAIFLIFQKFIWDLMPLGWSSLIVTILLMSGIQLIALGMIGEYLGRVLLTLNFKPQYIITKKVRIS